MRKLLFFLMFWPGLAGAVSQDADAVLFLRADVYKRQAYIRPPALHR